MAMLFFALVGIYIIFMVLVMIQTIKRVKKYQIIIVPSVFIILLLIPTWDYILGKQVFDEYCKNEVGLHIYEDIQKVDSIFIPEKYTYNFLEYPYKFVEGKEGEKYIKYFIDKNTSEYCTKYSKRWLNKDNCIAKIEIKELESKYIFDNFRSEKRVSKILNIKDYISPIIYERKTGKKIAELVDYRWGSGWFLSLSQLRMTPLSLARESPKICLS